MYYRDMLRCYCGGDSLRIEFIKMDRPSIREREVERISQVGMSDYLDTELDLGKTEGAI